MTRRLLFSYLAVTVVVLLLLEVPLAIFYQQREQDRLTVDVERDATVLATIYEDALEDGFAPDPQPAQDYFSDTGARTVVVDADGISIVDTGDEVDRDFSTRPEIATALSGARTSGTRFSETLDNDLLYVAVPVASGGVVHGALRLTLGTDEVDERVYRFWLGLAAIGAIILLVMAGIGTLIARSVTRPLRRLRAAADRYSLGDLTPTEVDATSPPELAALEIAMNHMAHRLDELIDRHRSFVADASHQLRTPLTALRLRLENLESDLDEPTSIEQIGAAIDECVRLSTLVDDLLRFARTEQSPELRRVDLGDVVRDRVDTWTATADLHDVDLRFSAPPGRLWGTVVDGGIEQVLDNLLDNAIRAAPPGTAVDVVLRAGRPHHHISVADNGPGIADADKDNALTRFWRADTSTPGSGLGLAICDAIVTAAGGRINLDDHHPTGLAVTVDIVAAPSGEPEPDEARRGVSVAQSG